MKKQTKEQIQAINHSIKRVLGELKWCQRTCRMHGSPLRSITFRVLDDGSTKLHITYKRL